MVEIETEKKEKTIAEIMRVETCDRATAERKYEVMLREASEYEFMMEPEKKQP